MNLGLLINTFLYLKREDTLVKACTGKVIGKGYRCFSLGSNRRIEFIRKMRTIGLVS